MWKKISAINNRKPDLRFGNVGSLKLIQHHQLKYLVVVCKKCNTSRKLRNIYVRDWSFLHINDPSYFCERFPDSGFSYSIFRPHPAFSRTAAVVYLSTTTKQWLASHFSKLSTKKLFTCCSARCYCLKLDCFIILKAKTKQTLKD